MIRLIAIEAYDEEGEACSRRTFELGLGLSEEEERAEIEGLVAHAHPAAVKISEDSHETYFEPGRVISVRPVVPPPLAAESDHERLFAA